MKKLCTKATGIIVIFIVLIFASIQAMALPDDTVAIGSKAFTIEALIHNVTGIQEALDMADGKCYYNLLGVTTGYVGLFDNKPMTALQKKELGAITLIDYDKALKKFTTTNYTDFDTVETSGDGLTRFTPANVNQTVKFNFDDNKYSANLTLTELSRGQEALTKLKQFSNHNDTPEQGKEYILAKFKFDLVKSSEQYDLSSVYFDLISDTWKEYDWVYIYIPSGSSIRANMYEGASHEGYVAFICDVSDKKPVINFERDYEGKGGAWFKAY